MVSPGGKKKKGPFQETAKKPRTLRMQKKTTDWQGFSQTLNYALGTKQRARLATKYIRGKTGTRVGVSSN